MIELLKKRYGWEEAIIDQNGLVQTNRGLKRIHYWYDSALMKWHIDWRDNCNVTPYVIMDRMLRTIDGSAYVQLDDCMVTVHDEIKDAYGQIGHEENWGCFLGRMIECGRKHNVKKKWEKLQFEQLNDRLKNVSKDHRDQINGFIREAQKRTTNVFKLIGDNEVNMPVMDWLETPASGKGIFGVLVVNGSDQKPVEGYESLIRFLNKWLIAHGQESFHTLLDNMNRVAVLTKEEQRVLLAESLRVQELESLLHLVKEDDEDEMEKLIQRTSRQWDETRLFVSNLATWLDGKKVMN
ncbi:hypothetical protein [Shouchella patagoniensis]|uniref:hypothetical protein n=1 Tax=Shouchella patagoniensis TaxID=228576 RepID=UPI0009953066|nr:hypothetical protein [Shouchella patagoniensis]